MSRVLRGAVVALLLLAAWPTWSFTVEDDRGTAVSLQAPAERVVALAPFITELVYAVGKGESLVAVSKHSDYPQEARELPRVGDAFNVNVEALLNLRPDLVMSWGSGNDPRLAERLETLDIPVFVLEPRRISDVPRSLARVGRLLGASAAAERQAAAFSRAIDATGDHYAGRRTIRVFYQVARRPLVTLNGEHMFTAILDLCGGRNVFQDASAIAPTVNREQVLNRDPQVILISSTIQDSEALVEYWSRYPSLTAARLGNLYLVDSDLINRQTPRLAEGAKQVCGLLDRARQKLAGEE